VSKIIEDSNLVWFKETETLKLGAQNSRVKTVLTAFLDAKSIIHHDFVLGKQTVNSKFYKELIKGVIARIICVWPEF
jgi:hypothetical protein